MFIPQRVIKNMLCPVLAALFLPAFPAAAGAVQLRSVAQAFLVAAASDDIAGGTSVRDGRAPVSMDPGTGDEGESYGSCGNATTVARDIYNSFGPELKALGCTVGTLMSGGGLILTSPCMASADKIDQATRKMIEKWNDGVAHNSWATIGPRRWHVEPEAEAVSHDGTIQAWGTRIFVHQQPFMGDKIRVSIRKVEGENPTEITVCKTDMRGTAFKIWEFRIDASDPDGKLYTKEFTGVKGWVLSTQLAGKNAVKKLEYKIRGTKL